MKKAVYAKIMSEKKRAFKRKAPTRIEAGAGTEIIVGKKAKYSPGARKMGRRAGKERKRENKFFDDTRAAIEVNFDSVYSAAMFYPTQGDSVSTRDGNKVRVTGIQVKGLVKHQLGAGAVPQDSLMRVLIEVDKRANLGGVLNISNILTTTAAASDPYQLRNRGTGLTERFRVIKDEMFQSGGNVWSGSAVSGAPCTQAFEWFLPCDFIVEFGANAGAGTDVQSNLINIHATSNIAAAGVGPTLEYKSRVSFEDV